MDELKELGLSSSVLDKYAKSKFFKDIMKKGRDFEEVITRVLSTIDPPFKTLIENGYKKLSQIQLKGMNKSKSIVADDLLVKEQVDNLTGLSYFRGVLNDSKLTNNSPWTDNQLDELVNVFKNDKNISYIEFEVRTSDDLLSIQGAPANFIQSSRIRIYREDVFKTISNNKGQFGETLKLFG